MSCAVCGQNTCDGGCAPPPASPEGSQRQALIKKAGQRSPRDTLPDYDDPEEQADEADLDAGAI